MHGSNGRAAAVRNRLSLDNDRVFFGSSTTDVKRYTTYTSPTATGRRVKSWQPTPKVAETAASIVIVHVHTSRYTIDVTTRERLVTATQELLWARGYAATSPKDIQTAASAGQGSMYHHFQGKQDLAHAALVASAAQMREEAESLLTGPGTAVERIETYLRRQRDSLRGCRMGRMTYDADVLATPSLLDPVSTTFDWLIETIADVLKQGIDNGELRADIVPATLACTIAAVVQGGYVLARASGDAARFDAAVEGAASLLKSAAV